MIGINHIIGASLIYDALYDQNCWGL